MNIDALIAEVVRLRADVDSLLERQIMRYAAGTWTPAFTGTSTAGAFTYAGVNGHYVRLENIVFIRGDLQISAIGTPPTGNMTITGLPYTAANIGAVTFGVISNFNYAASAIQLGGDISGVAIRLTESFDNSANVAAPAANFTNVDCRMNFAGLYLTS